MHSNSSNPAMLHRPHEGPSGRTARPIRFSVIRCCHCGHLIEQAIREVDSILYCHKCHHRMRAVLKDLGPAEDPPARESEAKSISE